MASVGSSCSSLVRPRSVVRLSCPEDRLTKKLFQFEGQPGQTAYAATKGAVRSMALPMARDLARHAIRTVTIAPGVFKSNMTDMMPEKTRRSLTNEGIAYPRRFGQPDEFAQTVRWILECPYVNGETIRLSGAGRLPGKL